MAKKIQRKKTPLRQPVQDRARKTRERILQVSRALISEEGIRKFNTNRVAQDAHISVATLYQYFPNKEAIVDELIEDYLARASVELTERIGRASATSLPEAIRIGLGLVIELFREEEKFFMDITYAYQNPLAMPGSRSFEQSTLSLFSEQLERTAFASSSLKASVYVAYQATMAVLSRHLVSPEPGFSDDIIIAELCEMICSYLKIK